MPIKPATSGQSDSALGAPANQYLLHVTNQPTHMFFLDYKQQVLLDDDEPSRFVNKIAGTVGKYNDDDVEVDIGKFSIFVIDAESAFNERVSLLQVFDMDQAIVGYHNLFTPNSDFKPSVCKALQIEHRWAPNLLVLDRLELYPEYRGQGDGLRILQGLMRRFAMGCGLVAMKPYPLQFEGGDPAQKSEEADFIKLRLDQFSDDFKKSEKRLQNYYAKIGFVRLRGSQLMVADPLAVKLSSP